LRGYYRKAYPYPNGHSPFPGIVLITAIWGTDEEMQELADAWAADGRGGYSTALDINSFTPVRMLTDCVGTLEVLQYQRGISHV
jgi:hypothetical protein